VEITRKNVRSFKVERPGETQNNVGRAAYSGHTESERNVTEL
jgi:hypothetical protein